MSSERTFDPYVPRGVLRHLAREPFDPVRIVDGSMLFADLSGFTKLSEKLQRRGPEGAELLVGTVNGVFASLLRVAYDNDGSLIKFGGDALLLFFEGPRHAERAARSAFRMRERLRTVGKIDVAGVRGVLRMTVGVHSDTFHFFLVGESHLEHLVLGPGATGTVETEGLAENGQIVVSAQTAALLPSKCIGASVGPAFLLRSVPVEEDIAYMEPLVLPPTERVARCLSTAVRAHVTGGASAAEHRRSCVAFLQFKGTNAILAKEGPAATAAALHELVVDVQRAADRHEVCFLDSDIDADGGKLLLTAGAPRVVGDDEERMLLTLRQIVEGERRLPIRIGVNRGPTFTGELGPPYRRSYIVMGDTTNLAARVMGKSTMGQLWATPGILERSATKFDTVELEPFAAKGKAKLVQAYAVGPPLRHAVAAPAAHALPLIGRDSELAELAEVVAGAREARGGLVELNGASGVGKTRLLEELQAPGVRRISVACEAHLSTVPYSLWHGLLRRLLGLAWADDTDTVIATLRARAQELALAEDLPLLGDVLGVELPATERSAALLPQFRAARTQEAVLALLTPERMVPTLLEVDGAHLIDEASAGLLGAFAPHLPTSNWVVLLVQRAGHGHRIAPPHRRIAVDALPAEAARALAHAATDATPLPPRRVAEAVARSGGNPQFLLDLLAASGTDLPDSAQAAAMAQIDALAPGDRLLVRRASPLGSTFSPELAAAVLGEGLAWDRVASVVARTPDGHLRFVRATLREAAYAAVPWAERRALHARVAQALEAGAGGPVDPGVLAEPSRRAGRHDRAFPLARPAAARALARA
ncbi:MAG: adenylate/guanylate cyclase domain-containing protein, partial [Sporichthyaceae bacterium]